jgi:hypothetical protein
MKRMSEKDFTLIKTLTQANVKKSTIREVSGRGVFVIGMVERSDSFEDYRKNMNDYYVKFKKDKMKGKAEESASTDQEAENSPTENTLKENDIHLWNSLEIISKRLDHIESMLSEHIDSHQAELTLLKSKKIIW